MARPLSITLEIEANELRRRIALGDTAPVDTRKALQQLGVLCVFMPMQETFSGMCLKHKEKRFMLVNSKVALGRQHLLLHMNYIIYLFKRNFLRRFALNPLLTRLKSKQIVLQPFFLCLEMV